MTPAPNAQPERNAEIKRLYKSGVNQPALGRRFGLTQSRISAILCNRLPAWRPCRRCRARCYHGGNVCRPCVAARAAARMQRSEERRARRQFLKALRCLLRRKRRSIAFVHNSEVVRVRRNVAAHFRARQRESVFKQGSELYAI